MTDLNTDEILMSLGRFGRWHWVSLLTVAFSGGVVAAFHMLSIVYVGAQVGHHCKIPDGHPKNVAIPIIINHDGQKEYDKCNMYRNFNITTNETVSCTDGWTYDTSERNTIVNEWDLVCGKEILSDLSHTFLVSGTGVGALLATYLADQFGRRKMFIIYMVVMGVFGTVIAVAPAYWLFVSLRFLLGFCFQGLVLARLVLIMEMYPSSRRSSAAMAVFTAYSIGIMLLSLLAYLIRSWRYLMLAISLPEFLVLAAYWIIPESIPWLLAKGRVDEAWEVLERAARWNRVELPEKIRRESLHKLLSTAGSETPETENISNGSCLQRLKRSLQKRPKADNVYQFTLLDVFKSKILRVYVVILSFLWFVNNLVYYGLSLNVGNIGGDVYLNSFLMGFVETPSLLITLAILKYIGRKPHLLVCHIGTGILMIIMGFIPDHTSGGVYLVPLRVTIGIIGKIFVGASYGALILYTTELYPTSVRTVAAGVSAFIGRLGSMIAPFSATLARQLPWCPTLIIGICAVIAGLLVLLLPETRNRSLPQTIDEIEKWKKEKTDESAVALSLKEQEDKTDPPTDEKC